MSLPDLQKLKIMWGNDMYPSIDPREQLLLDTKADPEIGDVVLFENRYGIRIPHRLLFRFMGYYFTRGDNCAIINFPFRGDKLLGVIHGKRIPVHRNPLGEPILALLLPYYELYSRLFDMKRKKHFILLTLASRFYPHIRAPPPDAAASGAAGEG
jgi:hypothetical protein